MRTCNHAIRTFWLQLNADQMKAGYQPDRNAPIHKGHRIEVCRVGRGWRASIYSPGSTAPWRDSPVNLESSRSEEIVTKAKEMIDVRQGPRLI